MHYRRLGRTNLQVSEIGLGTVELGMDYGLPVNNQHIKPSEADAIKLLNQALDWGVNFIDTARSYGTSEEVIGKAISHRRSEYILASKVHYFPDLHGNDLQEAVEKSVYDSLHALKTDYVDLMQIHSLSDDYLTDDLLTTIQSLKTAGLTRFIGATTYGEDAALAVIYTDSIDCLQVAYNLVDREMEPYVLPRAQLSDIGIIARSVLLRGALTNRHHFIPSHLQELKLLTTDLEQLAQTHLDVSLVQLAYRFVLSHPTIATVLCGTARLHELKGALFYAQLNHGPLDPDTLTTIRFHQLQDRNQLKLEGWSV